MATVKDRAAPAEAAQDPDGKAPVRLPRPVKGPVNYDEMIGRFMKRFPKTRARLAK